MIFRVADRFSLFTVRFLIGINSSVLNDSILILKPSRYLNSVHTSRSFLSTFFFFSFLIFLFLTYWSLIILKIFPLKMFFGIQLSRTAVSVSTWKHHSNGSLKNNMVFFTSLANFRFSSFHAHEYGQFSHTKKFSLDRIFKKLEIF